VKKRLNFELELQYKAGTKCNFRDREDRWSLGREQGEKGIEALCKAADGEEKLLLKRR